MNNDTLNFDIFDNLFELCFLISEDGRILKSNSTALEKLSVKRGDLLEQNFFDLIDGESKESFLFDFKNNISLKGFGNFTTSLQSKSGSVIDTHLNISSSKGVDGKIYLILARDISEDKKKELDLLRFYNVAENTVNPLQITDTNGNMIYVNPAFQRASGYTQDELLGKNPSIFSSGKYSKKYWAAMWERISSGKVWVGEIENKKKNGEPFYTQLLVSPILSDENKVVGYFGIHRDITDKKNLEKQLLHTQKMESIGTLAAGVAHEVGNPLASISALVQVAQRSTQDEFIKDKLELVKKQVTRISKIIRDLVDFSRPSNYELTLTDVNQNILEAVEIVKVGKKAKDVEFTASIDDNIPMLPLVPDQIQQVFVNILINAVDAITEDKSFPEEKPKKQISVTTAKNEENIIITFEDNGMGISDENLTKIFEPFYTTKKEGKGTGLGLWVSYGIIKSFQGDIEVKSKEKKGTKFIITLPTQPLN